MHARRENNVTINGEPIYFRLGVLHLWTFIVTSTFDRIHLVQNNCYNYYSSMLFLLLKTNYFY